MVILVFEWGGPGLDEWTEHHTEYHGAFEVLADAERYFRKVSRSRAKLKPYDIDEWARVGAVIPNSVMQVTTRRGRWLFHQH